MFCILVKSPPSSFKYIQLKGRPCVDVIEEMTGMHEEEEGWLRRQLTIAEVGDGVRDKSKYGVTAPKVRERHQSVV